MDIEKLIERLRNAGGGPEGIKMCQDAATALSTSQAENEQLRTELEQVKRERGAAVADLRQMCVGGNTCAFCIEDRNCGKQGPGRKTVEPCWQWRGPEGG